MPFSGPNSSGLPLASANINWYVAPYGSDSNSGLSSGTGTTNGATSTSSPTLDFLSVPSFVTTNMLVWDVTTNLYIGEVLSTGTGVVTLTANAANAVGSGDTLTFSNPLLTIQHAVNLAAGYNWNTSFGPNIYVANGTYTGVAVILPVLINCFNGGNIQGGSAAATSTVLTDNGSANVFNVASYSTWSLGPFETTGTHGGLDLQTYATVYFNGNWATGGTPVTGINLNPGAILNAEAVGTWSVTATSITTLLNLRGFAIFDFDTIDFPNAITVGAGSNPLIFMDSSTAFLAVIGTSFTNTGNITYASGGTFLEQYDAAYFEANATTLNNGSPLTRSNTPGGGSVSIGGDGSIFQPDNALVVLSNGLFAWTPNTGGSGTLDTGLSRISNGIVGVGNGTSGDISGTLELEAINLIGSSSDTPLTISTSNTVATGIQLNNTSAGGHQFWFYSTGSANTPGHFGIFDETSSLTPLDLNGTNGNLVQVSGAVSGFSSSATSPQTGLDTGLARNAAGIIEVNNGTKGTLAALTAANVTLAAGTATVAPINFASGTNLTTAAAGAVEYDGKAFYATSVAASRQVVDTEQFINQSGTHTLAASGSAQAIFNATTNGAITLAGSTTYEFEMMVAASGFSGSAHTLQLGFALGGGASVTSIGYFYDTQIGSTLAGPTASLSGFVASASATTVTASGTTTGLVLRVRGTIRMNVGGTVTPQLTQVTANAAAIVQANSFARFWPVGSNTVTNVGDWS